MIKWKPSLVTSSLALLALLGTSVSFGDSKAELNVAASDALAQFYAETPTHQELSQEAAGALIFPRITKGGAGVGGEYGEGVLQVNGKSVGYFKLTGASVGATLGVGNRSEIVLFMTREALQRFMKARVWTIGADTQVAVISKGVGSEHNSETLKKPILAFVFGERGLLEDVSLEGTTITRIRS